jgi:nucleoside-diphosphate-sugar epimerase
MTLNSVLVVGAGAALGLEIVRALCARGVRVTGSWRTPREGVAALIVAVGGRAVQLDLADGAAARVLIAEADAVIFTPILSVSSGAAALLRPDQRAVFFSSNNVVIDPQADVYARLLEAETAVAAAAPQAAILRPTMIYGYPGDGNLSRLMAAMRRWPATPIAGDGAALQQPLYFKDLARAAVETLYDQSRHGAVHAVAGPEPVTMRALYEAAASAAGARTRIIPIPVNAATGALQALESVGLRLPVKAAQLRRATRDKTPRGNVILTQTPLAEGLKALAAAMDAGPALDGSPAAS